MTTTETLDTTDDAAAGEAAPAKRVYKKGDERRQEILSAVVTLLGKPRLEKFTTKEIAAVTGLSEAALYRHFTNKAEILRQIVAFCETSFASMFAAAEAVSGTTHRMRALAKVQALLQFAEKNPGITRLLTGEALVYEDAVVLEYMNHVIDKAEMSVRQTLKLAILDREIAADTNVSAVAGVYLSYVIGRWRRYTQSQFKKKPTEGFGTAEMFFGDLR